MLTCFYSPSFGRKQKRGPSSGFQGDSGFKADKVSKAESHNLPETWMRAKLVLKWEAAEKGKEAKLVSLHWAQQRRAEEDSAVLCDLYFQRPFIY